MAEEISVDAFSLVVRSLRRQLATSKDHFSIDASRISFFGGGDTLKHVMVSIMSSDTCYVNIGNTGQFRIERPSWFFRKSRKKFDETFEILKEMLGTNEVPDIETAIVRCVPAAKDVIAEKAIGDDDT